jgi:hypothetical protein
LEAIMNTQFPTSGPISFEEIEMVVQQARAERAEVMRAALSELPALVKRLVARLRPNREPLPRCGAWV